LRFLLDTMVVSEPAKPTPSASVIEWLAFQVAPDLAISVLTVGEIARGVGRLPPGKRKSALQKWLETSLPAQFDDRVLPINVDVGRTWGELTAEADASGRPLPVVDGLLLATAKVYSLTLVTRNVEDFRDRGVQLLNPY